MVVILDLDLCLGCGDCASECPTGALGIEDEQVILMDPERCGECGVCVETCTMGVLSL